MSDQDDNSVQPHALRWWARAILSAAALTLAPLPASAQDPTGPSAKSVRLLPELQTLVGQNLPVGAVLAEGEEFDMLIPAVRSEPAGGKPALDRPSVVAAFASRWSTVFSISDNGQSVTLVSPRALRCGNGLARRLDAQVYYGAPFEVLYRIAASFDQSLKGHLPPGMLSSGPGSDGPSLERLTTPVEVVVLEGATLQTALNELAGRSALGWFAKERCTARPGSCVCQVGLITPTSLAWTGYDLAAELPFNN